MFWLFRVGAVHSLQSDLKERLMLCCKKENFLYIKLWNIFSLSCSVSLSRLYNLSSVLYSCVVGQVSMFNGRRSFNRSGLVMFKLCVDED